MIAVHKRIALTMTFGELIEGKVFSYDERIYIKINRYLAATAYANDSSEADEKRCKHFSYVLGRYGFLLRVFQNYQQVDEIGEHH